MLALTGAAAVLALAGCGSGGDAKAAAVPPRPPAAWSTWPPR